MQQVTRTYFTLSVIDMPRALAFYREVLGPVIRRETPTWAELKFGDATVALHASPTPNPKSTALGVDVVDLDAACLAVVNMGGEVLHEMEGIAGQRAVEVRDTEGNTFTLSSSEA